MAEHTTLNAMTLPGTPCLFLRWNHQGSTPSSAAWYSDRPTPMMAFSTDKASAAIKKIPTNHCTHDPAPKICLVKLTYSVNGSNVDSDKPSTATNISEVMM